ncbi:hypothetical protein ACIB24_07200 [Spongisporangium articulatum]|uniref:Galactose oxidase n=1 Tax=Spongisporangium articulatum TaxID=3362603 RepID=A0ABW8AKG7_9ACTN
MTSRPVRPLVTAAVLLAVFLSACGGPSGSLLPGSHVDTVAGVALPPAPLTPRERAVAVWTGTEYIVLGGQSGWKETTVDTGGSAAFDPGAAAWKALPPTTVGNRSGASALVVGSKLVVWGGQQNCAASTCASRTDGAVYSLADRTWEPLTPRGDLPGLSYATGVSSCGRLFFGAGGTGQGPAKTDAVIIGSLSEKPWEALHLGAPVYSLTVGPWGVAATVRSASGLVTHVLDGCTGEEITALPGPRLAADRDFTGLWSAFVGDALWLGVGTTQSTDVYTMSSRNGAWTKASSFNPSDMSVPNGPVLEYPGWVDADANGVYAVTATGAWAYSSARGELHRLSLPADQCGSGSAAAMGRGQLFVWGGQNCRPASGNGQTADGRLFDLAHLG